MMEDESAARAAVRPAFRTQISAVTFAFNKGGGKKQERWDSYQRVQRRPMEVLAAALLAALATTSASAQPSRAESFCRPPEAVLFACRVGARTVSICGWTKEQGGAVYRYGRPGRLEVEAADLHRAFEGWPGGGEAQAYADTPTHRYVVFDRMVRTGFDEEGHNIPRMTQGLLVQSGGRTLSRQGCAQPVGLPPPGFDQRLLETLVPEGAYVPH